MGCSTSCGGNATEGRERGIPKKGSRAAEVDGKRYCYIVRVLERGRGLHDPHGRHVDTIDVTIQEDVDGPGNVLQAMFTAWTAITPNVIAGMIRKGIKEGWDPSARGAAVRITGTPREALDDE